MSSRSAHIPMAGSSRKGTFASRSRSMASARSITASSSSSDRASSSFRSIRTSFLPSFGERENCDTEGQNLTLYHIKIEHERARVLLHVFADHFDRDGGIEHSKLVGQAGIINLQDEPRVDHGLVRALEHRRHGIDRKSTRLNSSHLVISYAVFCLKKKSSR